MTVGDSKLVLVKFGGQNEIRREVWGAPPPESEPRSSKFALTYTINLFSLQPASLESFLRHPVFKPWKPPVLRPRLLFIFRGLSLLTLALRLFQGSVGWCDAAHVDQPSAAFGRRRSRGEELGDVPDGASREEERCKGISSCDAGMTLARHVRNRPLHRPCRPAC
ncbi:uncharacterized protein PAC_07930 [Phialocephala subalpina]|uniref:Uncharacterized protein n=1 Tax=Phialocephala subalpina TaxID=576137 RepID=A0A1L7WZ53_9HELO|nr:uncharacterized protein PAC_07930 [Phialocephala subalpina]